MGADCCSSRYPGSNTPSPRPTTQDQPQSEDVITITPPKTTVTQAKPAEETVIEVEFQDSPEFLPEKQPPDPSSSVFLLYLEAKIQKILTTLTFLWKNILNLAEIPTNRTNLTHWTQGNYEKYEIFTANIRKTAEEMKEIEVQPHYMQHLLALTYENPPDTAWKQVLITLNSRKTAFDASELELKQVNIDLEGVKNGVKVVKTQENMDMERVSYIEKRVKEVERGVDEAERVWRRLKEMGEQAGKTIEGMERIERAVAGEGQGLPAVSDTGCNLKDTGAEFQVPVVLPTPSLSQLLVRIESSLTHPDSPSLSDPDITSLSHYQSPYLHLVQTAFSTYKSTPHLTLELATVMKSVKNSLIHPDNEELWAKSGGFVKILGVLDAILKDKSGKNKAEMVWKCKPEGVEAGTYKRIVMIYWVIGEGRDVYSVSKRVFEGKQREVSAEEVGRRLEQAGLPVLLSTDDIQEVLGSSVSQSHFLRQLDPGWMYSQVTSPVYTLPFLTFFQVFTN